MTIRSKNPLATVAVGLLALWILAPLMARAQESGETNPPAIANPRLQVCAVCGKTTYFYYSYPTNAVYVCADCSRIETHCAVCGLPTLVEGAKRTEDGRLICKRCIGLVVLTQEEAVAVFSDVQSGLDALLKGALRLKYPNVVVKVYATDYWNEEAGIPHPAQQRRVGFTLSRALGGELIHNVSLVSGTKKSEMTAICAHEYMHCWINENRPKERAIDPDTIEGLCELVAYDLVRSRGDEASAESIKANPYTRGKILTAIASEDRVGMPAILQWVKTGSAAVLDNLSPAVQPAPPPVYAARPLTEPSYNQLVLNGIVGTRRKKLAMINGQPFEKGEEAAVQSGGNTVMVRCLEITANSVAIQVDGAASITLTLPGK